MSTRWALYACLAATWFMLGLIVFVRAVHYPLFGAVGPGAFRDYHAEHVRRTTRVVLIPMVVELALAGVLAAWPPPGTPRALALAGLAAALLTWVVTGGWSVPAHDALSRGLDPAALRSLLRADLVRVAGWAAHALILLAMAWRAPAP